VNPFEWLDNRFTERWWVVFRDKETSEVTWVYSVGYLTKEEALVEAVSCRYFLTPYERVEVMRGTRDQLRRIVGEVK